MKTRFWLLCGALALTPFLTGCVGTMVQRVNNLVDRVTGADDPNNQSFMARSGRVSRQQSELGMSLLPGQTPETANPAPAAVPAPEPVATPVVVPAAPAAAPEPAKSNPAPAPTKKVTAVVKKPASSVKPVAAKTASQKAAAKKQLEEPKKN